MILGAVAAFVQADMTPYKRKMLASKGINVDRLYEKNALHRSKAEPLLQAHRARAQRLRQEPEEDVTDPVGSLLDELDPEAIQQQILNRAAYWQGLLIGAIDGFVSEYNADCRGGLVQSVESGFAVFQNIDIYNPTKIAKFNIANVSLTEATNQVYAFCDVSHLVTNLEKLIDFDDWEQYMVLVSRIGGALINIFPNRMDCIRQGQLKENGYDVGYCALDLASTLLDTSL